MLRATSARSAGEKFAGQEISRTCFDRRLGAHGGGVTREAVSVTRTVPGPMPALRIASVPADHVYVHHLSAPDGTDGICRLTDPVPDEPSPAPGQWWPPRMLAPTWVREHAAEFDVMHVQFG